MELAQDRVQWRALVSAALNLRILLPESLLVTSSVSQGCSKHTVNWEVRGHSSSSSEQFVT
jgi:hypothetical protein